MTAPAFESLKLPHRDVPPSSQVKYRVYSDAKNFVTVEAENAKTALNKSGITEAFRIERDTIMLKTILHQLPVAVPPPQAAPVAATPVETPAPAQVASELPEAVLSPDDVSKLLQS